MPNAPRVTVIIPTWNWSTVLPYSIGGVLRQTWTDFELLVVGDCCTDDSAEVVKGIAATDSRVRWINLPENFGQQAGPNNEGLRQARGELISYLGHDDLWFPGHLAAQVAAIDAGADLVLAGVASISVSSQVSRANKPFSPGKWFPPTGVMHRKSVTDRVGGWKDWRTLEEDPETELWSRMHADGAVHAVLHPVTAIKFAAAVRKDAYKLKSCREQSHWTQRMLAEPDLAEKLTAAIGETDEKHASPSPPRRRPLWFFLPWRIRLLIRRYVYRQFDRVVQEPGEDYRHFFKRRLRHKGADVPRRDSSRKP